MMRIAFCCFGISHFEVPLFRLLTAAPQLDVRVFHRLPLKSCGSYDKEYQTHIDWGFELDGGYSRQQTPTTMGLLKALEDFQPDACLMYGYSWPGAMRVILKNRLRGLAQVHRGTLNSLPDPRHPMRSRVMRNLRGPILRSFDTHHYGGACSREVLTKARVPEHRLFFVPYSVDTSYFVSASDDVASREHAARLRHDLGVGDGTFVILFMAQHNWFKGPDLAIRSFMRLHTDLPQSLLIMAGAGRMTPELMELARNCLPANRVVFPGFVSSKETVHYYLASDVVICTSRYETWARMTNEAMACQRACIASTVVPAAGDLIVDGVTGLVVQEGTPEAYARAILRYARLPVQDRRAMQVAARAKAMEFAYEPHLDAAIASFRRAVDIAKEKAGPRR